MLFYYIYKNKFKTKTKKKIIKEKRKNFKEPSNAKDAVILI